MPTARELLEQADALMRRNRAGVVAQDDIPELTDEVPVAGRGDVVPMGARPVRSLFAVQAAAPADRDDVPELIDAVEEIEAVALEPMPDEGGEESRWLETNLGAVSITGPAPDSIAVVPRATPQPPHERDADPPRGASAEAGESTVGVEPAAPPDPPPTSAAATLAANADRAIAAPLDAGPPTRDPAFEAMLGMADAPTQATPAEVEFPEELPRMRTAVPDDTPATAASEAAFDEVPARTEVAPDERAATPESETAFDEELNRLRAAVPDEAAATPETETAFDEELNRTRALAAGEAAVVRARVPSEETAPPAPSGASSAHPLAGDAARWDSLAEDVRMQVLQRIDIFTDTGLQEQLTARLQPIVDRASADLVATINQHVGQLLRAYVAEAIEREIEKWRQGNR
jgi:hypothetical protein